MLNKRRRPPGSHLSRLARSSPCTARDDDAPSPFCVTLTDPLIRFFSRSPSMALSDLSFLLEPLFLVDTFFSCSVASRLDRIAAETNERESRRTSSLHLAWRCGRCFFESFRVLAAMLRRRCRERRHGKGDARRTLCESRNVFACESIGRES